MDWPAILDVALKGNRPYIRGADMLEATLQSIPALKPPLSLRCHHLTAKRMIADRVAPGMRPDSTVPGILVAELDNENCILELRESDSDETPPSVSYDESYVVRAALVEGTTASMPYNADYSFSDNLVALNKKLLMAQPDGEVTWLLTRLDLTEFPASPSGALKISMAGPFSLRLVRSTIELAGRPIGAIFFSAATQ